MLYVNCIISWIYARLYQYITPYTDPTMNKKIGPRGQPLDWEFHHAERAFIENRISMMDMDATYFTQMRGVNQLMDLKKAHCACEVQQADREINLLYQRRLPNSSTNRGYKESSTGNATWIFCSNQFLSTDHRNHWSM